MTAKLFTDGACLGNPGPMGLGVHLILEDGEVHNKATPHGRGTNNVAEYSALIAGLRLAKKLGVSRLEAFLDSQLVVKQILREYRVKDASLAKLAKQVWKLSSDFDSFSISHIPREQNSTADSLSKQAALQV